MNDDTTASCLSYLFTGDAKHVYFVTIGFQVSETGHKDYLSQFFSFRYRLFNCIALII